MLNPQTDQEWIDGFLREQLVDTELINFHQKLKDDSAFTVLFEEQKILAAGIRLARMTEQLQHFRGLQATIQGETETPDAAMIGAGVRMDKNLAILEKFKTKNKKIDKRTIVLKNRKRISWLVAASLLFIISSLGLSFWANQNFSNEALIQKYSHEIDFNKIRTSRKETIVNSKILNAYANKNYKVANILLQEQKETPSIQLQLLQGYLYLQLNEPQKAMLEFSKIEATNDRRFIDNVKWYKVLAYLQMGEEVKSKTLLKTIIKTNKPWYEAQAKVLLKTLDHPLRRITN